MESSDAVRKTVTVLRQRAEIVAHLREKPLGKPTLVEELDIARSTLDRAIRDLEAVGIVTYSDGKYAVTPVGERLARNFFAFLERVELTMELEPFLLWAPIDEFDLDLRVLTDAEMVIPEPANPYATIERRVQRVKHMDQERSMLPLAGLHAHEAAHERIVENGAESELIVDSGVADVMFSDPAFAGLTEEMVTTDRFALYVSDEPIPYYIGVFDDETVQIGVNEEGSPRALVETDRQEALAWAHDTIDTYKQQATMSARTAVHDPLSV